MRLTPGVLVVVLLLLLVSAGTAHAATWCDRLQIKGLSYHFDRDTPHQEINPGLGCERRFRNESVFVALGFYDNSNSDLTLDAHAGWLPVRLGRLCPWGFAACRAEGRFGGVVGVVYGYENRITPLPPIPAVRYEGRRWGVTTFITDEVVMAYLTLRFK